MSLFKLFNFSRVTSYQESDFIIINKIPNAPPLEIKKDISYYNLNIKYKYKDFNEYKIIINKKNKSKMKNKSRRARKKRLKKY